VEVGFFSSRPRVFFPVGLGFWGGGSSESREASIRMGPGENQVIWQRFQVTTNPIPLLLPSSSLPPPPPHQQRGCRSLLGSTFLSINGIDNNLRVFIHLLVVCWEALVGEYPSSTSYRIHLMPTPILCLLVP
jgi:hypothetical protein